MLHPRTVAIIAYAVVVLLFWGYYMSNDHHRSGNSRPLANFLAALLWPVLIIAGAGAHFADLVREDKPNAP